MAFYSHKTAEKTWGNFSETMDKVLEASIELAPHIDYQRDKAYQVTGVGKIFNGTYRFKSITHTFTPAGYTVSAEARMVFDSSGRHVENGAVLPTPPKSKAVPKKKADKVITARKGDTLSELAQKYCKTYLAYKEIAKYNNLKSAHKIYPNQKIKIPGHLLK